MIQIIFELRIDEEDSKLIWKVRFKIYLKSKVQNLFDSILSSKLIWINS